MNDFADLRVYAGIVLRQWWLMILAIMAGAAIGFSVSQAQPRVYQAAATLIVGQSIQATQLDSRDILTSEQLAQTYADIARRQPVLQRVVDTLGLKISWRTLKGRVAVKLIEGTQLLEIRAESTVLEEAERIADEIANQLILLSPTADLQNQGNDDNQRFVSEQLKDLQTKIEVGQARVEELEARLTGALLVDRQAETSTLGADQVQSIQAEINALERLIADWQANYAQMLNLTETKTSSNYLTIIEPAQLDASATRPNIWLNTALAGAVGFVLALGVVVIRAHLDDTLKSSEDLSRYLDLAYLGAVGRSGGRLYRDKLTTVRAPFSRTAEDYRIVRSNIQFMSVTRPIRSIVVTSPTPGAGKTTTVGNLGVVMAQAGHRTILVDADLRRPMLHQLFHIADEDGLTDLLSSPNPRLNDRLRDTDVENLRVITCGMLPPNPSELLGSSRMKQLLDSLAEIADIVVIDSPPVLGLADTVVLSKLVDGVMLVFEAGRTRREAARQAISSLQQVEARLLGGILNQVSTKTSGYGTYAGYGYSASKLSDFRRSPYATLRRIILRKNQI